MKIVDIRATHPMTPDTPRDWRGWLGQILVAVETEDGLTGYGVGGGGPAGVHVVRTVLREVLLGQDARDVEGLWMRMYRQTLPFGRKGLAIMALSGVDLALWDLRGKREGRSIARLLGGSLRPIPAYATVFKPEDAAKALKAGYRAIKIHLRTWGMEVSPDRVADLVRGVRETVGPEVEIMADAFMSWDIPFALEVARRIASYNLTWLEEPLPADDLDGYARLVESCPVPIAGGEHEFTAAAFEDLMRRRLHAVFQPDVCWCGGLTQLVKIYEMASQYGVRVCPHRGSEVWALHAIAALDPQPLAESGRPWMTWVEGQPRIENGTVQLVERPGFGVTFDDGLWRAEDQKPR